MNFVTNIETKLKDRRPRTYRRLEATVNDASAPEDTRRVATFELKMLLPQIRRDMSDASFGEADRLYMAALIRRIDARQAERGSLPLRFIAGLAALAGTKPARI
jgi:hypothetical protein